MDLHGFGWQLAVGAWMTVRVAAASLVPGLLLGLAGAGAALSRFRLLRAAADTYSTVIRGVPELLVLLLLYFGGTVLLSRLWSYLEPDAHVEVDAFTAGVVALSFVFGAYATEVFRGAILAVPRGQIEAARALGMRPALILRRILLPQVWRFALPGLGNLWLVLLKDTSLISVVGLDELMRKAYVAAGSTRQPFTFYAAAACIYLLLTIVSMVAIARLEAWASRGVRRA
jgi:His/Glu/Gln/Arg/opine family amino acid ABC transporter permease subunit